MDAHAIQALEALGVVDRAARGDGLVLAAVAAGLAGRAAFGATRNPSRQAHTVEQRERSAERTHVAAIAPVHQHAGGQAQHGPGHVRPVALEIHADAGLERFDLNQARRPGRRKTRRADDRCEHRELDALEIRVQARVQLAWFQPQALGDQAQQFLEGAERAQPATERAAPPDKQRDAHESPEHDGHRVGEKEVCAAAADHGFDQGREVHDRELPLRGKADPAEREHQVGDSEARQPAGFGAQPGLSCQRDRQDQQPGHQDHQVDSALLPGFQPLRRLAHRQVGRNVWNAEVVLELGASRALRRVTAVACRLQAQGERLSHVEGRVGWRLEEARRCVRADTGTLTGQQQAVCIDQFAELDWLAVLLQRQPEAARTLTVACMGQRVAAVVEQQQNLGTGLAQRAHLLPPRRIEQVASGLRQAEQGDPEVDAKTVGAQGAFGIAVGGGRALEARLHLAIRQCEVLNQARRHERVPAGALIPVVRPARRRCCATGVGVVQPGLSDLRCRFHDALVDRQRRNRAGRDAVQRGGAVGLLTLRLRAQDLDAVIQRKRLVLLGKGIQRRGALGRHEDRLGMAEQANVEELAVAVDHHEQIERLAAVAADGFDVDGLEGLRQQHRAGRAALEDRPHRQRRVTLADDQRRREQFDEFLSRHHPGVARANEADDHDEQAGASQAPSASPAGWPAPCFPLHPGLRNSDSGQSSGQPRVAGRGKELFRNGTVATRLT